MKLTDIGPLQIDRTKIVKYLLNTSHPDGHGKALFFQHCGFAIDNWEKLRKALMIHGENAEIVATVSSYHGTRYIVKGKMEAPNNKRYTIRSVWIVEGQEKGPRLVTAYPY